MCIPPKWEIQENYLFLFKNGNNLLNVLINLSKKEPGTIFTGSIVAEIVTPKIVLSHHFQTNVD